MLEISWKQCLNQLFPSSCCMTSQYINSIFPETASHHLRALKQFIAVTLKASVNAYKLLVSQLLLVSFIKQWHQYALIQFALTSLHSFFFTLIVSTHQ